MPAFEAEVGMPYWIDLTTSDPRKSAYFYEQVLGMTVLERGDGTARLGTATRPLLRLTEVPGAAPAPRERKR